MNGYNLNVYSAEGTSYYSREFTGTGFNSTITDDARNVHTAKPASYGDTVSSLADERATRRLAGKANKMSINLGIAFAERKQTALLIESTARRPYHAALALKRGRLGDLYAALGISSHVPSAREFRNMERTPASKRISNYWLEYNFGWKPLLSDVYGACELLADHAVGHSYHGQIAASASVKSTRGFSFQGGSSFNGKLIEDGRIRYVAYYRLDDLSRFALASTGVANPLSVAWEILPYSFVVDWFLPVSGYLKTLQAFDGFTYVKGTKSKLWKGTLSKNFGRSVSPDYYGNYATYSGSSLAKEVSYVRDSMITFPSSVPPSFRNPLENGPLWKTLTSMALLRQLMSEGPSSKTLRL
jgi:hypothetical protein